MWIGESGEVIITRNEEHITKRNKPTTTKRNKRTRLNFSCINDHSKKIRNIHEGIKGRAKCYQRFLRVLQKRYRVDLQVLHDQA